MPRIEKLSSIERRDGFRIRKCYKEMLTSLLM